MELPPYRMPTLRAVLTHMWDKAFCFLCKIAGVILVGSIIIWFLHEFPRQVEWSMDYDAKIVELRTQPATEYRAEALARLERERAQESLSKSTSVESPAQWRLSSPPWDSTGGIPWPFSRDLWPRKSW